MMKYLDKKILCIVFMVIPLILFIQQHSFAQNTRVPESCQGQVQPNIGFSPNAVTLTQLNVRSALPEYSFLKGQWILGRNIDVLTVGACIQVVEESLVGQLQIWYSIKYRKDGFMKAGWVWAGTVGVDDDRYIGGYRSRYSPKASIQESFLEKIASLFHVAEAFAQADTIPGQTSTQSAAALPPPAEKIEGRIKLGPIDLSMEVASGIVLFIVMVLGMLAKAVWDQTDSDRLLPPMTKVVRPLLISPIAFSAFMGTAYLKEGFSGINLTAIIYSFQIGFMWQHVLETKGSVKLSTSSKKGT